MSSSVSSDIAVACTITRKTKPSKCHVVVASLLPPPLSADGTSHCPTVIGEPGEKSLAPLSGSSPSGAPLTKYLTVRFSAVPPKTN